MYLSIRCKGTPRFISSKNVKPPGGKRQTESEVGKEERDTHREKYTAQGPKCISRKSREQLCEVKLEKVRRWTERLTEKGSRSTIRTEKTSVLGRRCTNTVSCEYNHICYIISHVCTLIDKANNSFSIFFGIEDSGMF